MKRALFAALLTIGATRIAAWLNRRRVVFLCYHSITKRPQCSVTDYPELHVPLPRFVSQLDYLERHHHVIPLGEYLAARREGRKLPDYSAVMTFDDGTRNFLTIVAPLLAERGLPATAFVITENAFERNGSVASTDWTGDDDHLHLSWAEVRLLTRQSRIQIGSHSHTHPDLPSIPIANARNELSASLAAVTEHTGNTDPAFAYPYGRTNRQVREIAESLGYSCAFTGELGLNDMKTDLYALRRVTISGHDDLATFAARISGITWWLECVRAASRWMNTNPSPAPVVEQLRPHPSLSCQDKAPRMQMKKPSLDSIP
jgi:peptidoglycan/xylan/chitin deacetylase (PgdA/CDA1 family)